MSRAGQSVPRVAGLVGGGREERRPVRAVWQPPRWRVSRSVARPVPAPLVPPALALAVLTGFLPAVAGCRGGQPTGDPALSMELDFSPTPPGVGPARLILTLTDSAGVPVSGASIRVEGNMSHAGMVPVVDTAEAVGPGRYAVPHFEFSMAGDWVVTARATLPNGRWIQVEVPTRVFAAPPGIEADTALGPDGIAPEDAGPGAGDDPPRPDRAGGL